MVKSRATGPLSLLARMFDERSLAKRIRDSGFFDEEFYLDTNLDVASSRANPLLHFIRHGATEGRSPSPNFDISSYYKDNPEVQSGEINPIIDWLDNRDIGLRAPPKTLDYKTIRAMITPKPVSDKIRKILEQKGLFDKCYYASTYADANGLNIDHLDHYMNYGHRENRNPSAILDTHYYRIVNNIDKNSNPLSELIKVKDIYADNLRPPSSITLESSSKESFGLKIAVHIHLYYTDLAEYFANALSNSAWDADIFISTRTDVDAMFIERVFRRFNFRGLIVVKAVDNRGRDLAPFLIAFPQIWQSYDYVLHLHSKKSTHTEFGREWLDWIARHLIADRDSVNACIEMFENDSDLVMLFPDNYYRIKEFAGWAGNESRVRALLERFSAGADELDRYAHFAAGSMAWYRVRSLRDVASSLSMDDFDAEEGQLEGTFAHVLERALPLLAKKSGGTVSTYYRITLAPLPPFEQIHHASLSAERLGARWERDTPRIAAARPKPLQPISKVFNSSALNLAWIIPDFEKGAGGHTTIFRIIELLAEFGHRQTIWVQNCRNYTSSEAALAFIRRHYRALGTNVMLRFLPDDTRQISGDAIIATDCWTVFPAATAQNFKERFYFIQDYEPDFHPVGDNYLVARSTYGMGFSALCAGQWLLEKAEMHGMWARKWDLASDPDFYYQISENSITEKPPCARIAFYNREYTPRRAVQMGLAALEILAKRRNDFEVIMFGQMPKNLDYSFKFKELGVCSPAELGELYRSSYLGVAFSTTNYSLIPLEMMACGLAVVEIDVESTRAAYPPGTALLADPNVYGVVEAIEKFLDDPVLRQRHIQSSLQFVNKLNWRKSAKEIEAAIVERLIEKDFSALDSFEAASPALARRYKGSILIPTCNGGPLFEQVIQRVVGQKCDFDYDVLVIDSSSTDDTVKMAKKHSKVRVHSIEKADFQHGRSRNLGISLTEGEFIALLTQDAMPLNNEWFEKLLGGFAIDPNVAGVIGRHKAYDCHNPLVARDLDRMFDRLSDLGPIFNLDRGLPSFITPGSMDWQMLMHFYSDNNSAMRRDAWRILPYPDIDWGEDQVWAWEALKLGFSKSYVDDAVVVHSHDLDHDAQRAIGFEEGVLFAKYFGYNLHVGGLNEASFAGIESGERQYAAKTGLPQAAVTRYVQRVKASVEGRVAGYQSVPFA